MKTMHSQIAGLPRAYHPAPLRIWKSHLASDTLKAVGRLVPLLPCHQDGSDARVGALRNWFGIRNESHCFVQKVEPWLALSETQAMAGLKYFLNKHGRPAILAFLRASAPGNWPDNLTECAAEIEVVIPQNNSRIDMIVSGKDGDRNVGVVIEAKLGAKLTNNPLASYKAFARTRGLVPGVGPTRLLILDVGQCRETTSRLRRNSEWSLLSWHVLLVRLEKELAKIGIVDSEFAALRHQIWRRL